MPGKHAKRPGTTNLLVHVPDHVHAAADKRRRVENVTWSKVISTLLARWSAGNEAALQKQVRFGRPATPEAAEAQRLHEHAMRTNPAYARACTEKIDPSKLTRYRSPAALFAATAAREGRTVPADVIAAVEREQDDEDEDEASDE